MHRVGVQELRALVSGFGTDSQPVLLDVREPWEVARAALNLDGVRTVCIPMQEIAARLGELDPAQPVLGLCHHGVRSMHVLHFLERAGYAHVYNIDGGIDAWSSHIEPAVPRY